MHAGPRRAPLLHDRSTRVFLEPAECLCRRARLSNQTCVRWTSTRGSLRCIRLPEQLALEASRTPCALSFSGVRFWLHASPPCRRRPDSRDRRPMFAEARIPEFYLEDRRHHALHRPIAKGVCSVAMLLCWPRIRDQVSSTLGL